MKLLARLRLWGVERRKRAQRRDLHARLLRAWARLYELRAYVDRDRRAERRERDRLVRQIDESRARLEDLEGLLRAYLVGQAVLDSAAVERASAQAREALASGFGELDSRGEVLGQSGAIPASSADPASRAS